MGWAWLIPVLSFIAAPVIVIAGPKLPGKGSFLAILAIAAGFLIFWLVLIGFLGAAPDSPPQCTASPETGTLVCDYQLEWFQAGLARLDESVTLTWGTLIDPLTLAMLGLVTFVALMVQIYSLGYMKGDPRLGWYYAVHALFAGSMLTLVLADNFLMLYVAWELVGICSYLLIGFWHERPAAKEAAKKAFIVTRIGDVGLLVGILLLWREVGSFSMSEAFNAASSGAMSEGVTTVAALLILLGAMGKSAQFPFHVWLPDAMEGPTPVSALIHAASLAAMLGLVTFVALMVQIYSLGYMKGDPRLGWYYAVHALFAGSMLTLVLADNFLMLYVAWELVGICSYLLIGFWHERPAAKEAAKKAFIVTRIGDVGLLVGILLLWREVGSFSMSEAFNAASSGAMSEGVTTVAALLILLGAMGKSAQFPFHVWLPDAMEGPTPVSALIHAATMVVAGVYLVARAFPIFQAYDGDALLAVALVGLVTALMSASIALVSVDLKRILAYSTISHLGLMMLSLGAFGYTAAIFHLLAHGFAKALLFLGAGSVMHSTEAQDIRQMGGLIKVMPITAIVFSVGALSLGGIPLLAGFWSKDEILNAVSQNRNPAFIVLALAVAFMSAFYMARAMFVVFFGRLRQGLEQVHESPWLMTVPMIALAVLAVMGGLIKVMPITAIVFSVGALSLGGIPLLAGFWSKDEILNAVSQNRNPAFIVLALAVAFMSAFYMARAMFVVFFGRLRQGLEQVHESPWLMTVPMIALAVLAAGFGLINFNWPGSFPGFGGLVFFHEAEAFHFNWMIGIISTILALGAFWLASLFYLRARISPEILRQRAPWLATMVENKYYFDEVYQWTVDRVVLVISGFVAMFDRAVVNDVGVNGPADTVRRLGFLLRLHVTGHFYSYALAMVLGTVGLAIFWWLRSV